MSEKLQIAVAGAGIGGLTAAANTDRFHNPVLADAREAEAYLDREWAPDKVRMRYDWLFEHDVNTLPIT